jgi:hypothetical protein
MQYNIGQPDKNWKYIQPQQVYNPLRQDTKAKVIVKPNA